MGQQESVPNQEPHSARNYHIQEQKRWKTTQRIQHEGILKLRSTPFPDCVEIDSDGILLFLENAQMTLHDLIQSRLYTNRLFPCQDMQHLIENVTYTLAFLFEKNVIYKDMSAHNIYYNKGSFKLLPNQLIDGTLYERAFDQFYVQNRKNAEDAEENQFLVCLSPELVIALRMHEKQIDDDQIVHKSNVFLFGLILLQATTLMPASQCFDPNTYDIFNNIVGQRLELVEEHYNENIARIIANMIDYDYSERMDLKQLAIWINRELASEETVSIAPKKEPPTNKSQSVQSHSKFSSNKSKIFKKEGLNLQAVKTLVKNTYEPHMMSQGDEEDIESEQQSIQRHPPYNAPVKRSYSKSNMIYMNGYDDGGLNEDTPTYQEQQGYGQRNEIYLKHPAQDQQFREVYEGYSEKQPRKHKMQEDRKNYYQRPQRQEPSFSKFNYHINENPHFNVGENLYQRSQQPYGRLPRRNNYEIDYDKNRLPQNKTSQLSQNDAIRCDEGGVSEVHKFRDIGNIGNFSKQKKTDFDEEHYMKKFDDWSQKRVKGYEEQVESKYDDHTAKGHRKTNKYYPSLSDIENQQQSETKRLAKHSEIKNSKASLRQQEGFESNQSNASEAKSLKDGSINRIKMEVERSRKMIQEFRKSQGLTN